MLTFSRVKGIARKLQIKLPSAIKTIVNCIKDTIGFLYVETYSKFTSFQSCKQYRKSELTWRKRNIC